MEGCFHFSFFLQILGIETAVSVPIVFLCYLIQDVTPTTFWTWYSKRFTWALGSADDCSATAFGN